VSADFTEIIATSTQGSRAISIAFDLVQFQPAVHILPSRQDLFTRLSTPLSARLPVAPPG
jgi:hypothetical protein